MALDSLHYLATVQSGWSASGTFSSTEHAGLQDNRTRSEQGTSYYSLFIAVSSMLDALFFGNRLYVRALAHDSEISSET